MITRPIPPRPSLEFDRKQAKALLDDVRAGEPTAVARFREHHPRFHDNVAGAGRAGALRAPALHDAQLVIAREYGYASWPRWKQFVEARQLDTAGRAAELVRAAVTGDMRKAGALLAAEPTLAEHDFYTACIAGAAEYAARLLERDATLAHRRGGPLDREPILYACFSRFLRTDRARAAGIVGVVRQLLARGADPNVFYVHDEDGERWNQLPIYGAAGIANNPELTRLLLEAGADVNEGKPDPGPDAPARVLGSEDLYHACEFSDVTCLRLLLEAGPHRGRVSYALARILDFENPRGVELLLRHGADPNLRVPWMHDRTHLHRAIAYGRSLPIIRMLVEHGGDTNATDDRGVTPLGYAIRHGRDDLAALLREAGADDALVTNEDRAAGDLARGRASGGRGGTIDPDLLCNAACRNDAAEIRRLLAAGADPNTGGGLDGTPPLHWAVWRGALEASKALVEGGADIHFINQYDGDALDTALHGSLHCHDPFGGIAMKLPEEIPTGDYPAIVELLIDCGARPRKRLFGSDATQEIQRRHGVPEIDADAVG
jgi:ankyrin repeat protein